MRKQWYFVLFIEFKRSVHAKAQSYLMTFCKYHNSQASLHNELKKQLLLSLFHYAMAFVTVIVTSGDLDPIRKAGPFFNILRQRCIFSQLGAVRVCVLAAVSVHGHSK